MTANDDTNRHGPGTDERLDELERQQAKVASTVRALAESVSRLAGASGRGGAADATPVGPPSGEELTEWVAWLVDHYELIDIPPCWPRHGALVEEFEALRVAWLDSIGRGAGGLAAVHWHDALGRAIGRIHDARWGRWRRCLDNGHHDPPPAPGADGDPAERLAGRYRPTQPGPAG